MAIAERTDTPSDSAMLWSSATAASRSPRRERVKNRCSAVASSNVKMPPINSLGADQERTDIEAHPTGSTCGNGRVSAVQISCAIPRSITSSAMLAMKIANGGWPISGRNTNRSRISPNTTHASSVSTMPASNGICMPNFGDAEREGPEQQRAEHQHLALREIDDLGGAVDHHEGNRHQAVDQADQHAIDDDLHEA